MYDNFANLISRKLLAADIDQLIAIERQSFSQPWSKEAYLQEFANPNCHFFGIFADETLLAYGGYWFILDEAHIANIAVNPDYRRVGMGELIMKYLITDCLSRGGKRMTLEVRRSNQPAISLYQKLGFVAAGYRPRYYTNNNEDALIMWLEI